MRLKHRRQPEKTTGVIFTPLTPHKGHFLFQWPLSSVLEVAAVKSVYCIPVTCISNTEDRNNSKAQFCQVSATATSHRNESHCMKLTSHAFLPQNLVIWSLWLVPQMSQGLVPLSVPNLNAMSISNFHLHESEFKFESIFNNMAPGSNLLIHKGSLWQRLL